MTNYLLRPEVAGGLGEGTVMDVSVHHPVVTRLDYEFEDIPADDMIATFPCVVVTDALRAALEESRLTGFGFSHVQVSTSLNVQELHPQLLLPDFHWLRVTGAPGMDDMWIGERGRLIVNQRALDVLLLHKFDNCLIEAIDE